MVTEEGSLLRVELTADQLAELEGRTTPRWGILSYPEENVNSVIYLAFHPADAAADERAELIAPGSHRLEQMIASAHRQGKVTRATLILPGETQPAPVEHHPCLLVHFRVILEGRDRQEQLYAVGVDLTNGAARPELAGYIENGLICEQPPTHALPAAIELADGVELARQQVLRSLRRQDDGWARESLLALAAERRALLQYYAQEKHADGEIDAQALRLGEIERRCHPRALARPVLLGLIYAPVVVQPLHLLA